VAALERTGAPLRVAGEVRLPGDKSISHRALMFAALAEGASRVRGIQRGADVRSTADVLRALGADVPPLGGDLVVPGARPLRAAGGPLDCGNSGTTARLMAGILAAHRFESTLTGDDSLRARPMARVAEPLARMGATLHFLDVPGRLPMSVTGAALREIAFEPATPSAQVKSAILLAAQVAGVPARVREPTPTRDHTERLLRALGARIDFAGDDWIAFQPAARLPAFELDVPGDPSAAAFFAALGALAHTGAIELPGVSVNPSRIQFVDALGRLGARLHVRQDTSAAIEPTGTLVTEPSAELTGATFQGAEIAALIDELPLLACVGARARGETVIRDAAELRAKESDRIATVVRNLRALGVEAEELPDGMRIVGGDAPLVGRVETRGDHRIAMAFGVLGALPGSRVEIDDPECVDVSFPAFWSALARVTGARHG
jgi:3-phosphoshikimate 1-carboxyvinyltransferase